VTRVGSLLRLKSLYDDLDSSEAIVFSLVETLEAKDPYTRGHSERVAYYGGLIGEGIRLSEQDLVTLRKACKLHDIGKVGVRDEILNKEEKLSPEELEHIRTHPVRGYEICKSLKSFKPFLATILSHHERYDGKGWPEGLRGEEIPLFARICAIADTFDAMTSDRSYRRAMAPEQALAILEREIACGQWDFNLLKVYSREMRAAASARLAQSA
jgi:HD-GYP domain-containing protein (c-di-GMP phosphodiesterase class II)